jgi:predicted NBD/HSP70 family sugar kinase
MPAVTFTTTGALGKSALRQANEGLVLNAIRQNPGVSRADIGRITGLSPSSVTFIVKRLKRDKLLEEEKTTLRSQVGRQPTALHIRANARVALGIDLTLSGARIALTDLAANILKRKTVAWHANPDVFLDKVHAAIRDLADPLPPGQLLGAGVALPGFIDRGTGRVIAAENFNWFDVEVGRRLSRDLSFPFWFENMAKLSALAEMWASDGDARPLRDFVSITAHSGLGTGVIINGQILQGATAAASEFGHIILHPDGLRCQCGNTGCWEQYASDLALCRLYTEAGGAPAGEELEAADVVRRARSGDKIALRVLHETARNVGLGFVSLIMAFNPEAIVLADYLAEAWDLIEEPVWSIVRSRAPAYLLTGLRITPSRHIADTALVGAVALVLTRFFQSFDHGSAAMSANSVSIRASA